MYSLSTHRLNSADKGHDADPRQKHIFKNMEIRYRNHGESVRLPRCKCSPYYRKINFEELGNNIRLMIWLLRVHGLIKHYNTWMDCSFIDMLKQQNWWIVQDLSWLISWAKFGFVICIEFTWFANIIIPSLLDAIEPSYWSPQLVM